MRRILRWAGLACLTVLLVAAAPAGPPATFSPVRPGTTLTFPRDHGAHPGFRTEWWYVTGWLKTADGRDLGFQITFFRSRLAVDPANPSAFSPSQILFAHAGLSDPRIAYQMTGQMLEQIARDVRSWLDLGMDFQHVGIIVTTGDFQRGDLEQRIVDAFARTGVPL